MSNEAYRIHRVVVENVMRCVEFEWSGENEPVVCLKGDNGAGKSSIQRAILMALCGGREVPDEVLHDGAKSWKTEVVLGGSDGTVLQVQRNGRTNGLGSLTITAKDGGKLKSPQAVLDAIVSRVAIDPLGFLEAHPREQQEMLMEAAGVDFDLEEWAQRKAAAYEARRDANRDAKRLEAEAASMGYHDEQATIAEQTEIDVSAMVQRQEEATDHNSRVDNAKWRLEGLRDRYQEQLQAIRDAEERLKQMKTDFQEFQEQVRQAEVEFEKMEKVETSDIQEAINEAHATNRKIEDAKRAVAKWEEVDVVERNARHWDEQISALDEEKAKTLASADLPVPGLEFDESDIRYRGKPLEQASTGERLTVGIAVAAAMTPKLRVLFIDEASVLDEPHLKLVADIARERGLQVWLNTVNKNQPGILIEAGTVREANQ